MIDLHMHILPEVDDGAEDIEDAVEMAWSAVDSGVKVVAATSHARVSGRYTSVRQQLENYRNAFYMVQEELKKRKVPLKLCPGMEILVEDGILEALREKQLLTLNGSRYPLVEFYFDASERYIYENLKELYLAGYVPVVAHPERYQCVKQNPEILSKMQKQAIFQVNKGSLLGEFGRTVQRTADWILRHQLAQIVASDAHDSVERNADMDEIQRELEYAFGLRAATRFFYENPKRILRNELLENI